MATDGLKAFLSDHGEDVLRHAVAVAREELAAGESEPASRVEKECRQVIQRLLPDERRPDADGRPRLLLQAYLRAALAVREGIARTVREAGKAAADAAPVEREAARLLASRMLKAVALDADRRDVESRDVAAAADSDVVRAQRTIDRLTKLFEASPDGIVTLSEEGTVMTLNKAARSITGYRTSEIVGVQFSTLLADARGGRNLFKRLKKKWVSNYETLLRDKDGREVPISLSASVLESGEDDAPKMVFIVRDLSEVQEMKAQLIESEKLAAMAKIAGSVAHEIRNPLNSLFLNTDLLEDEIRKDRRGLSSRAEHLLSVVREEIDRLNNIIVNYLSLSKVSALSPLSTDVNTFLAGIVREKQPEADEARVAIVERYQPGLPPLFLDESQMRRVVFNLIQNAINAMPDGGTVTITTRTGRRDTVDVEVADTGVGIAPEHMPNVFHPFFSRLGGGTGLGLYLSREIVVNHQGKVSVQSEAGTGTTVLITLPVLDEWEER